MDNSLSIIQNWINCSKYKVTIIPRINNEFKCTEILGITEHSILGTIIDYVGGISISNNQLRHFGGENKYKLSINSINQIDSNQPRFIKGKLIVADDYYGGLFSINSNPKDGQMGTMMYLPPDSYIWEDMEIKHSQFVYWSLTGNLPLFYKSISKKTTTICCNYNEVCSFSPPLWVNATSYKPEIISSTQNMLIRSQILSQII